MIKRDKISEEELLQITEQLKDKKSSVRVKALESLAKMKHPNVFDILGKALSDKSPTVRVTAAENIGELELKEGVSALIKKLNDPNSEVRMRVVESLGYLLIGKKSPSALSQHLQDTDELVRIAVAESLAIIGDRSVLPVLRKALNDSSALVRSYVAEAIGKLGGQKEITKLEKELKQETSERAKVGIYQALYLLGRHSVLENLLTLLQSGDYRVRCATANALAELQADETDTTIIVRTLRKVIKNEPTVAVRSSIRSSLRSFE